MNQFVALIILDGLGISKEKHNNAFYLSKTHYLDYLFKTYPHIQLEASGEAVGLPEGQVGNSEVGHLNLGAGRVVNQYLTQINKSIRNQSFFKNEKFLHAIQHAKRYKSKIHLIGLVSEGGLHSHLSHCQALLEIMKQNQMKEYTYLHVITDGRDSKPHSGINYCKQLLKEGFQIASVSGRFFALDRDNNWDRLNLVYDMLTLGNAPVVNSVIKKIEESYQKGITDEFIEPFIVNPNGLISDNDSLIFFNFRSDRIMRLSTAFSNPTKVTSVFQTHGKPPFESKKKLKNILTVNMVFYSQHDKGEIAFHKEELNNTYGQVIADNGLKQLRIAETEKYPHVTFFYDGGKEKNYPQMDKILINSPKVKTYDLKPEMSAFEVAAAAKKAILSKKYQTMILNFANPDMVGHTGSLEASIKAVEAVDKCLKEVVTSILNIDGIACIVSDHGNCEKMSDEKGNPYTAHTSNLVPFIIVNNQIHFKKNIKGVLSDVAPTLLALLGLPQPKEMTGISLIQKNEKN